MVTITQLAEQKIKELMAEEKDVVGLRVYVRGGGCHGYQYGMAFESKMADDDRVLHQESASEDDMRLRQFLQCISLSGWLTTGVSISR